MARRFLLDTNILSNAIRNPRGNVVHMMRLNKLSSLCTSSIVSSEMRYGAQKKGSARLSREVDELLGRIEILDYDDDASRAYAMIRTKLETAGNSIGITDLHIAAHALSFGLTLVTDNVREFSRVEGLKVENWLDRSPAHE
jgi:tRNA(fMet)-specific endonuclease VapC